MGHYVLFTSKHRPMSAICFGGMLSRELSNEFDGLGIVLFLFILLCLLLFTFTWISSSILRKSLRVLESRTSRAAVGISTVHSTRTKWQHQTVFRLFLTFIVAFMTASNVVTLIHLPTCSALVVTKIVRWTLSLVRAEISKPWRPQPAEASSSAQPL